jgi:uncharacterized YccA/Bax inhibitor family protein
VFLAKELSRSFGYIEDAIELGAPKWMEWRAALGLMVAIIVIYLGLLNTLRKLLRRRPSRI